MLIIIWISFWLTYFIVGSILYNDTYTQSKRSITTKELLNTLGYNALITLLLCGLLNNTAFLIHVPYTLSGYLLRIGFAVFFGDLSFYWFHRLLHHPLFYQFHKKHHDYIIPHAMMGVYAHPIEMIFNFFSIIIGLTLTNYYSITMLCIESAAVAVSILISHRSAVDIYGFTAMTHNKHHCLLNCNYGFSLVIDWVFGTLR